MRPNWRRGTATPMDALNRFAMRWLPELVDAFIPEHAPEVRRADYLALWQGFVSEARGTLQGDHDYGLRDALALLRRECHVSD